MGATTGWRRRTSARRRRWASVLLAGLAAVLLPACADDEGTGAASTAEQEGADTLEANAGPSDTVRIVSQNLLHGITCPATTNGCKLPARVALFAQQLDEGGCPDVVAIQEANQEMVDLLRQESEGICDGAYSLLWDDDAGLDREALLSRLPVLGSRRVALAGPLRTAVWVRLSGAVGVIDLVATHLASETDDRPCDEATCEPPCTVDDTLNLCQARQVVELAGAVAHEDAVVVIAGDLNARPGSPTIDVVEDAGYTDTHLTAGNDECDRATGDQCTSGRIDDSLEDLTDPSSTQTERVDFVFVGGGRACDVEAPTGLFNAEPAEDGPAGLAFPSDHTAVEATLVCETSEQQLADAPQATVPASSTTTTEAPSEVDDGTVREITAAFQSVFDGDVTDMDAKLAALEDGDILRPYFIESYEAQGDLVKDIRVRIDSIDLADESHADVTYSLLLDGAAVLDHLDGEAVVVDGQWLVSRETYCDVSSQGASEIPPPCR